MPKPGSEWPDRPDRGDLAGVLPDFFSQVAGSKSSSFPSGRERCEPRGDVQTSGAITKITHENKACALRERIMNKPLTGITKRKLRSSDWFNNPHNPGMTALYLERYLNYGLTREELQAGKPIIGIAQTGNDLS